MKSVATLALLLCLALPARLGAVIVLLLSTGNSTYDQAAKSTLEGAGNTVVIGSPYTAFSSSELTGIDVVLLFPSANWSAGDMDQTAQAALLSFVASGGGLVTSEWTNWKIAQQQSFNTLSAALPVQASTTYSSGGPIAYTAVTADTVLNAGLPSSVSFSTDNHNGVEGLLAPKARATVFYSSSGAAGGAGVIGWDFGSGRVLQLSTLAGPNELASSDYSQLLQNAVTWTAVPEPSTLALLALGLAAIGWSLKKRRA